MAASAVGVGGEEWWRGGVGVVGGADGSGIGSDHAVRLATADTRRCGRR